MDLNVQIEVNGELILAGYISGSNHIDAFFQYTDEYVSEGYPSISISLPVSKKIFSPSETRNFFEGLLPEGFARKSVSNWIHAAEDDYLTILQVLGSECLGAIRISGEKSESGSYQLLSIDEVKDLAREGVSKSTELITEAHLSLTGASGKVGLYHDSKNNRWYKPIGIAPSTHIVKQSHVRLSNIVLNEQLCLRAASKLGIDTPESFIINTGGTGDQNILFATKRYDRILSNTNFINGLRTPYRLHQEDFSQALGIPASQKYEKGNPQYLTNIFKLIRYYTTNPIEDQLKLWDILVYDFLVGNTDNHIKNLSLLYSKDLKSIRLAPAYDILSTTIYPGSSKDMAIAIHGEFHIDNIKESHFAGAAQTIGFSPKMAMTRFHSLVDKFERAIKEASLELAEMGYLETEILGEKILKYGGYNHISR